MAESDGLPYPTQVEPEGLADELEQLLAKRADSRAWVHDRLTHFIEANKAAILTALRSTAPDRNAVLEEAAKAAYDALHPHPNHPESDWTEYAHAHAAAARKASAAIRALRTEAPAQVEPVERLADELEQLPIVKSVDGKRDLHWVDPQSLARVVSALRSSTVNDELVEALRDCRDQLWLVAKDPQNNPWVKQADAALAKIGGESNA